MLKNNQTIDQFRFLGYTPFMNRAQIFCSSLLRERYWSSRLYSAYSSL